MNTKRTRAERKAARRAEWARLAQIKQEQEQQKLKWQAQHPILSGLVPIVDYVPPSTHGL